MAMVVFCIHGNIGCIFRYESNSWCLEWVNETINCLLCANAIFNNLLFN